MEIRSDRRFPFDVGRGAVWSAVTRIDRYREWWPWLERFEGAAFETGQRWRCRVKPPVPYALEFEVVLVEVVGAERVRAHIEGDIEGWAELTAADGTDASSSEYRLVSELSPANGLLRVVARLARPIAHFGHDWVLDTGVRQFRAAALGGPA